MKHKNVYDYYEYYQIDKDYSWYYSRTILAQKTWKLHLLSMIGFFITSKTKLLDNKVILFEFRLKSFSENDLSSVSNLKYYHITYITTL